MVKDSLESTISPITFSILTRGIILAVMNELDIKNFDIRLMLASGYLLKSIKEYKKICNHLTKKKVNFFTHRRADLRPAKIVFSDCEEHKELLQDEYNILCINVKKF